MASTLSTLTALPGERSDSRTADPTTAPGVRASIGPRVLPRGFPTATKPGTSVEPHRSRQEPLPRPLPPRFSW